MKKQPLLYGYLESISGRVLETYPAVIREMIRGRHGVYALYKRDRLYYVGLASDLMNRLKNHLRDRHRGKWERFSVYLTIRSDHIKELESIILRIVSPSGNRSSGRFARSVNLYATLDRTLKETDADRRAAILGGPVAQRRRRARARRARGNAALAAFTERSLPLRAFHRGKTYKARLRRDGTIAVGKRVFPSPSAAARAVVKYQTNGWQFWCYRKNGQWEPLKTIRN